MSYVCLVVFGLCLGSFVNALVWRLHDQAELRGKKKLSQKDSQRLTKLSLSRGRSMCLSCGHELAAKDLVPVVSWLMLKGRCRYCGAKFPDTPVAELAVPTLFVLSYVFWPLNLTGALLIAQFIIWLGCLVAFVALALYDFRWFLLPDRIVAPLAGLSLIYAVLGARAGQSGLVMALLGPLLGIVAVAGLFYVLFRISNEQWIGAGDVKLGVPLGLLAGSLLHGLMLIFFASSLGLIAAVPQMIRGKAVASTKIPFGPFLLAGSVIVVLFGTRIAAWYTGLIAV